MPVTWSVEPRGFLRFVMVGAWSDDADSRATAEELVRAGHWHAETRALLDLRQAAAETAPRFEALQQRVTRWVAQAGIPAKLAIIAAPGILFGVSRMIEGLAGPHAARVRTFEDEATAIAWLLDEPLPRPEDASPP